MYLHSQLEMPCAGTRAIDQMQDYNNIPLFRNIWLVISGVSRTVLWSLTALWWLVARENE